MRVGPRAARAVAAALAGAAGASTLAGCSTADDDDRLVVYAAASLVEAFAQIEARFEQAHPGIDVVMVHAGSADLATQIAEGAPADVFASADEAQMAAVAHLTTTAPAVFATNTLTVVVPPGNPAGVTGLHSLGDAAVASVVCAPQVPCGAAAAELASLASVTLTPVSEETSVTAVLSKVVAGEADAGLVYVTDVARESRVEDVATAHADAVVNRYPIAALAGSRDDDQAQTFVDFVLDAGQDILAAHGFGTVDR